MTTAGVGVGLAHREGVVRQHAAPLAMAPLHPDHHAVQGGERLLQLQPAQATAPGLVGRVGSLTISPSLCRSRASSKRASTSSAVRARARGGEEPRIGPIRQREPFERRAAVPQRVLEQVLAVEVEQVERDEHDRDLDEQRPRAGPGRAGSGVRRSRGPRPRARAPARRRAGARRRQASVAAATSGNERVMSFRSRLNSWTCRPWTWSWPGCRRTCPRSTPRRPPAA